MINTLQALVEEEAEQTILEQVVCLNTLIPTIHIPHSSIEEEVMVVVVMEGHQEVGIIRKSRIIKNTVQITKIGAHLLSAVHIILLISQHHMTLILIMIQVVPATNGQHQIIETGQHRDLAEEEEEQDHRDTIQEEEEEEEEEDKEEERTKDLEWKFNKDVRYT